MYFQKDFLTWQIFKRNQIEKVEQNCMKFDEWLMDRLTQSRMFSTILVGSKSSGRPLQTRITPKSSFWYTSLSRFKLNPWSKSCMEGQNQLNINVVFLVWDSNFRIKYVWLKSNLFFVCSRLPNTNFGPSKRLKRIENKSSTIFILFCPLVLCKRILFKGPRLCFIYSIIT